MSDPIISVGGVQVLDLDLAFRGRRAMSTAMIRLREPYTPSLASRARGSIVRVGSIDRAFNQPVLLREQMLGVGAIGAVGGLVVGIAIEHPGIGAVVGGVAGAALGFVSVVANW